MITPLNIRRSGRGRRHGREAYGRVERQNFIMPSLVRTRTPRDCFCSPSRGRGHQQRKIAPLSESTITLPEIESFLLSTLINGKNANE
jgi:hypothetical protein